MYSNFNTNPDYPILIWVDKQMFNQENKLYCTQLKTDYQNLFQAFDNVRDALNLLQQIGDKNVTIITSAEFASQLVQYTQQNLVIFCGNKLKHFDLFLNNNQIKAIISSSFQSAHENAILCMNQTDIYNDFLKLLSPPQQQSIVYQHSKDYVSIQFLVVIEEIRKNKEPKEEQVFAEIENLLTISQKQNKKHSIFVDLEQKEKQKQSNKKFSLFEKLIYLYSREEIYEAFNQQFAKHNYQQIKNIILCLYQGFKEGQQNQNQFKYLYRGISVNSQDIFQQIISDLYQSLCEGSSLFWNTITSTSLSYNVANQFSQKSMYGILYEIELDEDVPHPCFKLENYHSQFPSEQEVLLFPQFQFNVQDIEYCYYESKQYYKVFVKQVKNNYAFALDPKLRKIYWDSVIQEKIKPKIETLVNFQSRRIFEIIQFFEQRQDFDIYIDEIIERVEQELQTIFKQIKLNLIKILRHSNYTDILNQIKKLTQIYREIIKLNIQVNNQEQFFKQLEEYLDQVLKSVRQNVCTLILKGIINIEYQKEYLQNLQNKFKEKINIQQTIQVGNTKQSTTQFQRSQPIYQGNTAGLTYQQLKGQRITSLQQVQHKNGNLGYEATLQDGNKLLMHHNPNNNNELSFSKKIDGNGKNGYSNKWEKIGQPIKTEQVTVQEVQQSIKGQNQKFNVNNVKAIETNYQFQQARINGQIGGIIAGTVGSMTVDCIMDGVNSEKLGKGLYSLSLQGGIIYAQSIQSLGKVVPYVGIGFTALMTSISVGGIILSDFLSQSEKVYNSILIAIKTGSAIGLGVLGIEGGMALGAVGGPVGVFIGGILGGFVGGASGNLLGRAIDYYTQFNLEVSFKKQNKSIVEEGYLIDPGKLPKITWKQIKDKVKSLILIAQTDTHLACIIPNIDRNKTQIEENEDIGILFNQYKYIGPDNSCESITFRLLATTEDYVNEDEILQQLSTNETNIIDLATVKINLKNIQ